MPQLTDNLNGTIKIYDVYDISPTASNTTPLFSNIGDEYVLNVENISDVKEFDKFSWDSLGMTSNRYLTTYYRISKDGTLYSDWLDLNSQIDNFPLIDSKFPLYLNIKWVRGGSSTIGTIRLLEYLISGTIERNVAEGDTIIRLNDGQSVILKAPYIYKVFKINDIEILSLSSLVDVDIKYRYSQDNSRTWSDWEFLTKENISTAKINPIRFFQIEYSIENKSGSTIRISDINLIGDFQNVSKDYFKTNLFGIRECCQSNMNGYVDKNGNFIPNTNNAGVIGNTTAGISGNNCQTDGNGSVLPSMTSDEKAALYNPYQQGEAFKLLNKLTTDAEQVFGHKVIYFVTDPDKKGQDHTLHEYQLYNVSCEGTVKVSVEGNNFPDSQIVMNQFDLNLFQTMEVHITKQQFKEVFGPHRRPAKEDFLYFCDLNRMYSVDHAQQFRGFNNTSVYYKLILKKFNKNANISITDIDIKDKVKELTKNSTIDELFGVENNQDKAAVANKDQLRPLTKDPIRLDLYAKINKELIENSTTIISKSNYELSSVNFGETAVSYSNVDPFYKVTDNIGFYLWFNINNYLEDEVYNFIDFYDSQNSLGFKSSLVNDTVNVVTNSATYSFELNNVPGAVALDEEVWYCYVMNIDQRNRKLEQFIYKRDVDNEEDANGLLTNLLRLVYSDSKDYTPVEFLVENKYCEIFASDMKVTNIRLFSDILPEKYHNKLLNQYIIGDDSKYMIFGDNANSRIQLPNFPLNE
jgi:hypothetical protein